MSERGSFVTEYIYCKECFAKLKIGLVSDEKYFKSIVIPSWREGEELPIIAGKVGGLYDGEEKDVFDLEIRDQIQLAICHPVRIAVLCDGEKHDRIFKFLPVKP